MMEQIKKLRDRTGAGIVAIKKALDESGGDEEKAIEILRKAGHDKAAKKADRDASEGVVASYIHTNGKIGALVELKCETDFVARNEEFKQLAFDIAIHVASMDPSALSPEDVASDLVAVEKNIWKDQLAKEGKEEAMIEKIMEGKEKKFREEQSLLKQAFVKDPDRSVEELVTEAIAKMGENVQVGRFVRYAL